MTTAITLKSDNYEEIINAGVDDFFTKPLSAKLLLATIKKGIKRRSLIANYICLEKRLKNMESNLSSLYHNIDEQGKIILDLCSFGKILKNEMLRSKRYNHTFSLILLEANYSDKKEIETRRLTIFLGVEMMKSPRLEMVC